MWGSGGGELSAILADTSKIVRCDADEDTNPLRVLDNSITFQKIQNGTVVEQVFSSAEASTVSIFFASLIAHIPK